MPPSSLLSPLLHHVQSSPPVEFQLPEDIRTYFKFGEFFEKTIPRLSDSVISQWGVTLGGNTWIFR
jgi:hypothetical protein